MPHETTDSSPPPRVSVPWSRLRRRTAHRASWPTVETARVLVAAVSTTRNKGVGVDTVILAALRLAVGDETDRLRIDRLIAEVAAIETAMWEVPEVEVNTRPRPPRDAG